MSNRHVSHVFQLTFRSPAVCQEARQLRSLLGTVERRRSEYIVVVPEKQLLRLNSPFFPCVYLISVLLPYRLPHFLLDVCILNFIERRFGLEHCDSEQTCARAVSVSSPPIFTLERIHTSDILTDIRQNESAIAPLDSFAAASTRSCLCGSH